MKKSLVLAMALSLGIAGTAFAANPFSDVPANHWAYASVSKLAQAGVIDGYGDDTFRGGKSITRYEMAQMVAKAMVKADKADAAQQAMLAKLAAEFSAELNNLGVRVAKLEKNADNVTLNGDMRLSYKNTKTKFNGVTTKTDETKMRSRLYFNGQVNEDFKAVVMLQNTQDLTTNGRADEESNTTVERAYVAGNIDDVAVNVGRFCYTPVNGIFFDDDMDGITASFGNVLKTTLVYGRMSSGVAGYTDFTTGRDVTTMGVEFGYQAADKLALKAAYFDLDSKSATLGVNQIGANVYDNQVYELAANYTFDKNVGMWAEYLKTEKDLQNTGKTGWIANVDYKGMDLSKKGSWGAYARYYSLPAGTTLSTTLDLPMYDNVGIKAFEIGTDYAVQKNIQLHVAYADGKDKQAGTDQDVKMVYSYLRFFF